MSILQCPGLPSAGRSTPPPSASAATRPYTRAHNDLYDKVKPHLRLVDRSVLDALVRQLEGFHQPWVIITIPQLAVLAGVSASSVTQALARLTEAGVLRRRKKQLLKSGRYVWELALTDPYRVVAGIAPLEAADSPPPAPVSSVFSATAPPEEVPQAEPPLPRAAAGPPCEAEEDMGGAAPEEPAAPPAAPEITPTVSAPEPTEPSAAVTPETTPNPSPAKEKKQKESPEPLTPAQTLALEHLRSVGIDLWKAGKMARVHDPEKITRAVEGLKHRAGTVRNPAAWIVRELERGGYAPPLALAELEKRQQEQAVKALRKLQAEEHQAELARIQEEGQARLLRAYQELSPERQQELEQQVREQLRRVSPRLAQAPLDLSCPGPLRSELLELLQKLEGVGSGPGVKVAGPTPRAGGWAQLRVPESPGFSQPLQEPPPGRATYEP